MELAVLSWTHLPSLLNHAQGLAFTHLWGGVLQGQVVQLAMEQRSDLQRLTQELRASRALSRKLDRQVAQVLCRPGTPRISYT